MAFNAGQYCELIVPESGVARQYSMANPPDENRRLELHIKRTPGGLATDGWVFRSLKVGDRFTLKGPSANSTWSTSARKPRSSSAGHRPGTVEIHRAPCTPPRPAAGDPPLSRGRRQVDLYDVEFFTALDREHPNFHYHPALSEEDWDGATGMVTDVVADDFATCKGMRAYLCGPPVMVAAAVKTLKRRRMSPRLILREEFTPAPPTTPSES